MGCAAAAAVTGPQDRLTPLLAGPVGRWRCRHGYRQAVAAVSTIPLHFSLLPDASWNQTAKPTMTANGFTAFEELLGDLANDGQPRGLTLPAMRMYLLTKAPILIASDAFRIYRGRYVLG